MTVESKGVPERSYGCTYGCGNPFDIIMVDVKNGTTEFLCIPCFVHLAASMVEAMTNPDNPGVVAAMTAAAGMQSDQAPGPSGKPGRRNAPATNQDDDIFGAYDATITSEELPEEYH